MFTLNRLYRIINLNEKFISISYLSIYIFHYISNNLAYILIITLTSRNNSRSLSIPSTLARVGRYLACAVVPAMATRATTKHHSVIIPLRNITNPLPERIMLFHWLRFAIKYAVLKTHTTHTHTQGAQLFRTTINLEKELEKANLARKDTRDTTTTSFDLRRQCGNTRLFLGNSDESRKWTTVRGIVALAFYILF